MEQSEHSWRDRKRGCEAAVWPAGGSLGIPACAGRPADCLQTYRRPSPLPYEIAGVTRCLVSPAVKAKAPASALSRLMVVATGELRT